MSAIDEVRRMFERPTETPHAPDNIVRAILELADRLDKIAPVREPVRDPDGHEVLDDDGWTVNQDGEAFFRGNLIAYLGNGRELVGFQTHPLSSTTRIPLSVVRKMMAVAP